MNLHEDEEAINIHFVVNSILRIACFDFELLNAQRLVMNYVGLVAVSCACGRSLVVYIVIDGVTIT